MAEPIELASLPYDILSHITDLLVPSDLDNLFKSVPVLHKLVYPRLTEKSHATMFFLKLALVPEVNTFISIKIAYGPSRESYFIFDGSKPPTTQSVSEFLSQFLHSPALAPVVEHYTSSMSFWCCELDEKLIETLSVTLGHSFVSNLEITMERNKIEDTADSLVDLFAPALIDLNPFSITRPAHSGRKRAFSPC